MFSRIIDGIGMGLIILLDTHSFQSQLVSYRCPFIGAGIFYIT